MSVRVEIDALRAQIDEIGDAAFLVTVNAAGEAHVASVRVRHDRDALRVPAGRTSRANAEGNPAVTLVWPRTEDGSYALLVDGRAVVDGDDVVVDPSSAILHRLATADASLPGCVTVEETQANR